VWRAPADGQTGASRDPARELDTTLTGPFTLASVGDLIIMRPASEFADDGLQSALKIIRDADTSFGNFEGSISDMRRFTGPMRGFMGTKEVAADLKAMGFDLLNRANNHVFDSEADGMFATNELLEAAGIVHAGAGRNLQEARAAQFLETPKGRIALVGMHTPTQNAGSRLAASYRVGNTGGKPGLNALGLTTWVTVSADQLAALKKLRDTVYQHRDQYTNPVDLPTNEPADRVQLFGTNYRAGTTPGEQTYTMNQDDLRDILRSIRNGKQYADFAIATIHTHQGTSTLQRFHFSDHLPGFLVTLAHAAIDNGADAFVGYGVHVLRGVEIYKGKPIFYGLGDFFREMDWTVADLGRYRSVGADLLATDKTDAEVAVESWSRPQLRQAINFESMIAGSRYDDGRLVEIRLHPTELRHEGPISRNGIPRIAPPEIARRILERVQALSKLGTTIAIDGNVGVIRVAGATTSNRQQ
jgi:poly-gamma-glutamate capsule biosynthesis protein CapA/YwtB (metallophosphatase superfamily)